MSSLLSLDNLTSIIIASVTIIISNCFTYLFALKKDSKQIYSKYKISILEELYTPIYKIILREVNPLDGYEGISGKQFTEIKEIISDKYILVDPVLDNIIWSLKEDECLNRGYEKYYCFDKDRRLLTHVERQYNKLRKSIGLPYEKNIYFKKIFIKIRIYCRRRFKIKRNS